MKEITATAFRNNKEPVYNLVNAHQPVKIINQDRPDIILVDANDYFNMQAELEKAKAMLKRFRPEYVTYPCGDERYFNGNFEWNEDDDQLMFELIDLIDSLDKTN